EADIQKEHIFNVSTAELKKGVEYLKNHREEIKNRVNGTVILVHDNNEQEIEYGTFEINKKIINDYYLIQQNHNEMVKSGQIRGQVGSSGKVIGTAKVIQNFELQKTKLNPGEILVTGMTRPEFVPLMKIAAGIITDEGGVTCHAAIVSRELGIPCVIGTKIATQILHDGDLVEVDADKGVVRILERAK
ncbi:MAG: PEP-utilizing enzyme, partial [Patescibacteria group bacterium]